MRFARITRPVIAAGAALTVAVGLSACTGTSGASGSARESARSSDGETATMASSAQAPVRIVAAGDIACAPGEPTTATTCRDGATARLVRSINPAKVLALGDTQYEDGTLAQFRGGYDETWGTFKGRTIPVVGNHEYRTAGAAGYYRYFGRRAPGWYRTTIGSWQVYVLNTNCRKVNCEREETWLRSAIANHPSRCAVLAMHHPRYSSGLEHGSAPSMKRFWTIADRRGVDLVLAGHDHDYERFAPMNAYGQVRHAGMVSFVVGTGGKSLYHRGSTAPGSRYFRADRYGVLALSLGSDGYGWSFRVPGGGVRDAGSRACVS